MGRGCFIAALLAGCYSPAVGTGAPCTTSNDCPSDQLCVGGVCGGSIDAPVMHDDADVADVAADGAAPDAAHQVVVLGDDAAEVRDVEIWIDFPTTNYAGENHFSIDLNESSLLWFDLTSIATNRTVVSATLTIKVADAADEAGGTATLHRMREAWVEAEATWTIRATNQAWSVAGARSPASDVAPLVTFSPAAEETTYNLVLPPALVQAWIADPAVNFGLLFQRGTSLQHVHIHSRETQSGPRLRVELL
ncbi:MAG TPA: DNRLRE domain-containing protein [Kofleriaceae bacterium]